MHEDGQLPKEPKPIGDESKPELFDSMHDLQPIEEPGYEVRDFLGRKGMIIFGAAHFFGIILTLIVVYFVHAYLVGRAEREAESGYSPPIASGQQSLPSGPRLQTRPDLDMERLVESEENRLESYGWADEQKQKAHVPISVVIDKLAGNLPSRPAKGAVPR